MPVVFAVEDIRRFYVAVGQVDRRQLAQLGPVDEHLAVRFPVLRHSGMHGIVTGIFGDEHFANGRGIVAIETLKGIFEQIEPPTTGHDERDVTLI
ncbi:hypothetical protein D3C75_1081860 [compost metagenome]